MAITVTNNVPNTSYNIDGRTITLTADTGYKFETKPTYFISVFDNGKMNLSADGTTATVTVTGSNANVTLDGSTVADVPPQPKEWNVSNEVPNSSFTVEYDVLTLTADTGYKFESAPQVRQGSFTVAYMELSADSLTATLNLSSSGFNINNDVYVNGSTEATEQPQPQPTEYTVNNEVEHTTFEVTGNVLTLTADTGYKFETPPKANNFAYAPLNEFASSDAVLTDDNKQAVFDLSTSEQGIAYNKNYAIKVFGTVVVDAEQGDLFGSINVYELTEKSLRQFAEKRFNNNVDMGDYVVKLFRLFAPVGETKNSVLTCGNYNLEIEAQTPVNYIQTLDFGSVEVPRHNNSTADNNSEIKLFLPFIGFTKIDNVCLGKQLNLKYTVNVVTGEAVVHIFADGVLLDIKDCQVSTSMLYKTSNTDVFGNDKFDSKFLYGFTPFVKLIWYESQNKFIYNVDCQRTQIKDVTGFARITEIEDLQNAQMTADERMLIMNQLNIGVYVE